MDKPTLASALGAIEQGNADMGDLLASVYGEAQPAAELSDAIERANARLIAHPEPVAELTDEEIVGELAKHGIGMLGHTSDVEPFPLDGDDAPIFIAAYRALLARSPAQPEWALKQKWHNEGYNDGKEVAPAQPIARPAGDECLLADAELADPEYMKAYIAEMHDAIRALATPAAPEQKAAQPAAMPNERDFSEWLNAHRDAHVSSVFHDIVGRYRAVIAALPPVQPESKDAERLDFVLAQAAWILPVRFDHPAVRFQLMTQNEDEEYITLSGEDKSFATEREAIDAAIAASQSTAKGADNGK